MVDPSSQTCPICSVQILVGSPGQDRVIFASGPQGSRAKLWARVCQFNQKAGCINPQGKDETITETDYYKPLKPINDTLDDASA